MTKTAKSAPSTQTPVPAGSFDKKDKTFSVIGLNKTGAVNYSLTAQYRPDDIVIACDPEHPAYEAHSPARYEMTDPDNQADRDSILTDGLMQNPLVCIIGGKPVCAEGSRRIRILRDINAQSIADGGDPIAVEVKVKRRADGTLLPDDEAYAYCLKAHAGANEHRKDDNPMSRARKMRLMLKGVPGKEPGTWVRKPVPIEDVARQFKVQVKAIEEVTGKRGLFALAPELQAALELPPGAPGYINQSSGLHIAAVSNHDTQRAMYARLTGGGSKAVDRDESRKLARETAKNDGVLPDKAETSEEKGGGTHEIADYRPTRSALERVRGGLRSIAGEDGTGADLVCAVVEYMLDPNGSALDDVRYDPKIVSILKAHIRPKGAAKSATPAPAPAPAPVKPVTPPAPPKSGKAKQSK